MKKFLRKSLIYLLMTMMVLPTWVVTGLSKAEHAQAADLLDPFLSEVYVSGDNDWVEIYNPNTDTSLNLKGYKILSESKTTNETFVVVSDIIVSPNEAKVLEKDKFDSELNLPNTSSLDWRSINFLSPGDRHLYNEVKYGGPGGLAASAGLSLQFINSNGGWFVGTPNQNVYNKTTPRVEIELWPPDDTSVGPYLIKIRAVYNADVQYRLDNGPLVPYDNIEVIVRTNGSHKFEAFAEDAIGQTAYDSKSFTVNNPHTLKVELSLNDGAKYTKNRDVKLNLKSVGDIDPKQMAVYLNPSDTLVWENYVTEKTLTLPSGDGLKTVYLKFKSEAGDEYGPFAAEITLDTQDPKATVKYSKVDPTNGPVVATLVPENDESIEVTSEGGLTHTFIENGSFTFKFHDLAGNEGGETATVSNINKNIITSPTITNISVSGKTITVTWEEVENALKYNVYVKSKARGVIASNDYGIQTPVGKVTTTQINVSDYGEYYVTVTAIDQYENESPFLSEIDGQKLVTVVAPTTVETSSVAPVTATSPAPAPVSVAAPKAQAKTTTPDTAQAQDDGVIKGDESQNDETNKINWTPWIVLFSLIVLAGAATGGYFYWFNGEEEVAAVVREPKKTKPAPKQVKTTVKPKTTNKKTKRW